MNMKQIIVSYYNMYALFSSVILTYDKHETNHIIMHSIVINIDNNRLGAAPLFASYVMAENLGQTTRSSCGRITTQKAGLYNKRKSLFSDTCKIENGE